MRQMFPPLLGERAGVRASVKTDFCREIPLGAFIDQHGLHILFLYFLLRGPAQVVWLFPAFLTPITFREINLTPIKTGDGRGIFPFVVIYLLGKHSSARAASSEGIFLAVPRHTHPLTRHHPAHTLCDRNGPTCHNPWKPAHVRARGSEVLCRITFAPHSTRRFALLLHSEYHWCGASERGR